MPQALGAFLESAAIAATLGAAVRFQAVLAGGDARGFRAAALGVLASLVAAGPLARRVPYPRPVLAAASAAVFLALAGFGPASFAGRVPPGTGGIALASALVFLFPVARAAAAAEALAARLPVALAGAAAGLFAGHLVLAPLAGERLAALSLAAALALLRGPTTATTAPPPRLALALATGAVCGALVDASGLFLFQYLSGTRFSWTLAGSVLLAGLALGSALAPRVAATRVRAALVPVALALAPVFFFASLAAFARARFPDPVSDALVSGGALVETLCVLAVLGLPSLLLGAAIGDAGRSARGAAAAVFGLVAGLHLGVLAMPPALEEALVRRRGRDMVVEHAIAGDGVFERVRSMSRPGSAVAHWNRDAVSRSAEWGGVARAEILAAASLVPSPNDASLLVVGSPTAAHATALAEAGFAGVARVDRLPEAAPGAPRRADTDVFRLASGGRETRFSAVVVLSKPFLSAGDGTLLTRDGFRVLKALAPAGGVLVWLDPGSLPLGAVKPIVGAFFAEYTAGSLVLAQDGVFGPLLGLASAPLPHAIASAASWTGAAGGLEPAGIEARLPLEARRSEHAPAPALGEWADLLEPIAPDVAALFEALGLLSTGTAAAANPFEEPLEALPLPADAVEALTVALERFPRSTVLRDGVAATGRLLLAQRESDLILKFGPRWIAARPEDAALLYVLGRQHAELLDPEQAWPLLERAAALDPASAEIRSTLDEVRAARRQR